MHVCGMILLLIDEAPISPSLTNFRACGFEWKVTSSKNNAHGRCIQLCSCYTTSNKSLPLLGSSCTHLCPNLLYSRRLTTPYTYPVYVFNSTFSSTQNKPTPSNYKSSLAGFNLDRSNYTRTILDTTN